MRDRLLTLPLLVILMGVAALMMAVPAIHALTNDEHRAARAFFYSGLIFLIVFAMLAAALTGSPRRHRMRSHLVALVLAFMVLPLILAVPLWEAMGTIRFHWAWFEMVSALTTTGATLFDEPGRVPASVHLWRGLVAWMGGLLMWISAAAVLAPLNLGGFEVISTDRLGGGARSRQDDRLADPAERLVRFTGRLAPVYLGLTVLLWIGLTLAGEPALQGAVLAMSTMATSGITAGGDGPGWAGEVLIFVFLFFALSRLTFSDDGTGNNPRKLASDPEMTMGVALVVLVPTMLFLRHWLGAFDVADQDDLGAALRALWGAAFTTLSFLTTNGLESAGFEASRNWSGLQTPGLVLMGLALFGGGVATTAGGVKLLRIYALYKHGAREFDKLIHPNSVGGAGSAARRMRREGAYLAWIFFMLFAISIALTMGALSLAGRDFTQAAVLSLAALTTTGPLAQVDVDAPIRYHELGDAARYIVAMAMILGRLETLALLALLNRGFWRS